MSSEKFSGSGNFKADAETLQILTALVEAKREQLKELDRGLLAETTHRAQIVHDQTQLKVDLERELAQRRLAFEQEIGQERLKLQRLQNALDQSSKDLDEQRREANRFISQGEEIRKAQQAIIDQRIGQERQRVQFEADREVAERSMAEAATVTADQAKRQEQFDQNAKALQRQEVDLLAREDAVEQKEAALATREEQVRLIKLEIDPKLTTLAEKQSALADQETRLSSLTRELQEHRATVEQRQAQLDGERKQVDARIQHAIETEARLGAWERELQRREDELPTVPPVPEMTTEATASPS